MVAGATEQQLPRVVVVRGGSGDALDILDPMHCEGRAARRCRPRLCPASVVEKLDLTAARLEGVAEKEARDERLVRRRICTTLSAAIRSSPRPFSSTSLATGVRSLGTEQALLAAAEEPLVQIQSTLCPPPPIPSGVAGGDSPASRPPLWAQSAVAMER